MKWLKIIGVMTGALIVTTLSIDAADTLSGSNGTLLAQLFQEDATACPDGMVYLPAAPTFRCVDVYEAAPSQLCPIGAPSHEMDTARNIADQSCEAVSGVNHVPWRFVTRDQAVLLCARSGKRLPDTNEWQLIAAGTPDTDACNIAGRAVARTGSYSGCHSASGVFDTVGNVWEWTSDDVFDGMLNGRTLPEEGYVVQVDRGGIATKTSVEPSPLFSEDYFWSQREGIYGVLRGGFYASESDAGLYTAHTATLPTMSGAAIGFRCVQ